MSSEENQAGMVGRWALRFGVGAGVLCAVWMLILHLTGNNAFGPKHILPQFLVPVAAVASQWALRRSIRPSKAGLGRAVGVGALTALLAALIAASSLYSLGQSVGPAALQLNRAEMVEIARSQRDYLVKEGGQAAYEQQLRQLQQVTLADIAQSDFVKILLLGLMFALPTGVFLRE